MKAGAIIQARMSSKRFPGKVLYKVEGKPMLQYLLEGLRRSKHLGDIVVATSTADSDTPIEDYCNSVGAYCVRGSLENVAGRFVEVLKKFRFQTFVRLNGDSPVLDYHIVDKAVSIFSAGRYDLVTNVAERSFPKGQSVEVIRTRTFLDTYPEISADHDREHVTAYFYTHQKDFSVCNFVSGKEYGDIQLSVDTREDMIKFKEIITSMSKPHWEYSYEEILSLLQQSKTLEVR